MDQSSFFDVLELDPHNLEGYKTKPIADSYGFRTNFTS